jgi:hypothetical protein
MLETERKTYFLSIRIWAEPQASGNAEWRGKLQLLPAGEAVYFQGLAALPAHLESLLANAAAQGPELSDPAKTEF